MASPIPASLKTAGLAPFATRAAQLKPHRPIVYYWLSYHLLNQILAHQLHLADDATQAYALQLMDTLETFKQANAANDAITDDLAARAYIENFALETFERGDEAQRLGKVTRQTADTFLAASTFIELLGIWEGGEVRGEEWRARARYAKFHAVRIAKAIKAGEDPNETNPVVEEAPAPPSGGGDVDEELRDLERGVDMKPTGYRAPAIEDESPRLLATQSNFTSAVSPHAPTAPPPAHDDVSPIDPPDRHGSLGGGYFPSVPGADSLMPDVGPPDHPPEVELGSPTTQQPPHTQQHQHQDGSEGDFYSSHSDAVPTPGLPTSVRPMDARPSGLDTPTTSFYAAAPPPLAPPPAAPLLPSLPFPPHRPQAPTPSSQHAPLSQVPAVFAPPPSPAQTQPYPPAQTQAHATAPTAGRAVVYRTDDEAVLAAQKHAKWAISALNFEDVETAVRELRGALAVLGAAP
ncbi:hypothetical protein LTR53_015578 [Teratosphaeriaceae sp. CCFEE 6253]|nr:hypothetical protein LTR53_015578 [Teratosphaeriaceae sp. CCFEE 6253]